MGNLFRRYIRNPVETNEYIQPTDTAVGTFPRHTRVRAVYNFDVQNSDDLRFNKDDVLYIISQAADPWWFAYHARTHQCGFIPNNYVVIDDGTPPSVDGWFTIDHFEADRKLLLMGYKPGTYILRPCSDNLHFVLSIRHFDTAQQFFVVKHYKIRTLDSGGYFINHRKRFSDIRNLLHFYTQHADGLCCRLTDPFPRVHQPPIQFRDIEVNRAAIRLIKVLGNGSFGQVYLGKWNNIFEVAVKTMRPNAMSRDKFIDEAKIMHKLNHPKIVQILGVCTEPVEEPAYIITELMSKGSLFHVLTTHDQSLLEYENLLEIMLQITDGMSYLENKNFVHRDLRAANILVAEDMSVKVADFGLARMTEENEYHAEQGTKFPVRWTAPEAGKYRKFSIKSDVWSFGILAYEIVTYGEVPYAGIDNHAILSQVCAGYRLSNPSSNKVKCPESLYNLMLMCWHEKPDQRPTFGYLKSIFEDYCVATEDQYGLVS